MTTPADSAAHQDRSASALTPGENPSASLEAGLLAELRLALADLNIRCELKQHIPCLAVPMKATPYRLWVFVTPGGRYFSWSKAQLQHPTFDLQGAARRIAAQAHGESE